jgi:putative N6-adenine-specific DNA methylase
MGEGRGDGGSDGHGPRPHRPGRVVAGLPAAPAFFASAARGTEGALRDELRESRIPGVRADRGGVHFGGGWLDAWRACLHSRIAVRVLAELARFDAPDGDALYEGVRAVDWTPWLTPDRTLAVAASCRDSALTHTGYLAQRTKDGVVDPIRERLGARPSVDRHDPDVRLFLHLVRDRATLYLDLAGEPLHRRGWRTRQTEAPLKETLAAAMLRLAGWDRASPLADPLCGSGTIPIEAWLWSRGVAAGGLRPRFGFERWACHGDEAAAQMRRLRDEAASGIRAAGPDVDGTDLDERALEMARDNAGRAGAGVRFARADVADLRLDGPGWVVTNPPYGERLETDASMRRELADALRRQRGRTVAVLSGHPAIERALGRPDRWYGLFNGDLECRLLIYHAR